MKTTYVQPGKVVRHVPELQWIETTAHIMDNAFRIPGTNIRFGLDPIIGLIPGIGELITFGISGMMVLMMARHGVSRKVVLMMAGNVMLDSILGSIPLLGDLFDIGFKSNQRNLNLLRKHYQEGKYQGNGTGIIIIVSCILLAFLTFLIWALWNLGEYIFGH